jgi:16S rRNA (guanine527-N7)-methyltransferase
VTNLLRAASVSSMPPRPQPRKPLPLPKPAPLVPPPAFIAAVAELGLTLEAAQLRALGDYLARLLAMNTQMNLTAIIEPDEAWMRHALDALALVPHLGAGKRIVDVGSGGGVPGIPLAIACPDRALTLVASSSSAAASSAAPSPTTWPTWAGRTWCCSSATASPRAPPGTPPA